MEPIQTMRLANGWIKMSLCRSGRTPVNVTLSWLARGMHQEAKQDQGRGGLRKIKMILHRQQKRRKENPTRGRKIRWNPTKRVVMIKTRRSLMRYSQVSVDQDQ